MILDSKNHVIAAYMPKVHTVYIGSLNTAVVRVGELFQAGEQARERHASEEAIVHFERGLALRWCRAIDLRGRGQAHGWQQQPMK